MNKIVDAEQLQVEEGSLEIIASAADGGMRDALSLLDQAISFSGDILKVEDALLITLLFLNYISGSLQNPCMIKTFLTHWKH